MDTIRESDEPWRTRVGYVVWELRRAEYYSEHGCLVGMNVLGLALVAAHRELPLWFKLLLFAIGNVAYGIDYYLHTILVLQYLKRLQLVETVLNGYISLKQAVARFGCNIETASDTDIDHIIYMTKQLFVEAEADASRLRTGLGIFSWFKYLTWLLYLGLGIELLLLALEYANVPVTRGWLDNLIELHLEYWLILLLVVIVSRTAVNFHELFQARFYFALARSLDPDLIQSFALRGRGSLKKRFQLAYTAQRYSLNLMLWIYGLIALPFVVPMTFALTMGDFALVLPVLAALLGAQAFGVVELRRWGLDLRTALMDTTLIVRLMDSGQHQTPGIKPRSRLMQSLIQLPDAAVETAYRLARELPRQLPQTSRETALRRLKLLAALYLVLLTVICAICWPAFSELPMFIPVCILASLVGSAYLSLQLFIVRRFLPFVEVLDHLRKTQ